MEKVFIRWLLLIALWVSGCAGNVEEVQIDVKNVRIVGLEGGKGIWDTVEFSVEARGVEGIQQVDIQVDDEIVASDDTAPFEFTWDTKTHKDGDYTIKAVVVTNNGKTMEKLASVSIKNILLTVHMDDSYLREGEVCYVLLSDPQGEVLAYQKVQGEGAYPLKSKDYQGERFDFNIVTLLSEEKQTEYNEVNRLTTYLELERGSTWHLSREVYLGNDEIRLGNGKQIIEKEVKWTNLPKEDAFEYIQVLTVGGNRKTFYTLDELSKVTSFSQQADLSEVLVHVKTPEAFKYRFFTGVTFGKVTTLDFDLLENETKLKGFVWEVPSPVHQAKARLYGFKVSEKPSQRYDWGEYLMNNHQLTFTYPEGLFKKYASYVNFEYEGGSSSNYLPGVQPLFTPIEGAASLVEVESFHSFTLDVRGEIDFYRFSLHAQDGSFQRIVVGPKGKRSFVPVVFPTEIQNNIPEALEAGSQETVLYDLQAIKGYSKSIQVLANPAGKVKDLSNQFYKLTKLNNSK
ncbi:Ig-like domain-containing protein [Rapidithrix thailandica]|uniref:Ig-like domain-containing protein n=1 Tax=Rapidithrix thailandica TaxID=413964 RepID=A0AAW9SAR9_9BACT